MHAHKHGHDRRHVVLPPEIAQHLPKNRLLSEVSSCCFCWAAAVPMWGYPSLTYSSCALQNEWRGLGVQQSRGWEHYAIHRPEPHIMLFRCVSRIQQRLACSSW